jgi:cobalt-zinc-cadmium efflux system membrane fusion protein
VTDHSSPDVQRHALSGRTQALIICCVLIAGGAVALSVFAGRNGHGGGNTNDEVSSQAKHRPGTFYPSAAQWAALTVEPVEQRVFRAEHVTEGKIAIDEDRATPIFSPYAGRVMKLLAKPGDTVQRGQPLFTVEATDMVQAQNDFIAAATALNKARSQLNLAQIIDKRQRDLYEGKAVPLKEVQQARAILDAAENDARSSEVALEAARNRLRILGKTDQEIAEFRDKGTISPETPIYAPIAGTVVQRKVGPGQYVGTSSSDPAFVIGDLSTVWLMAYVRETDAPKVRIGQQLDFTVLAYPDEIFRANIIYVGAALDPNTRRLPVRATIQNSNGLLKPEMFASVGIFTDEGDAWAAVPREAVIYEGPNARVWVVHDDKAIEARPIKTGVISGKLIQVLEGLKPGDKVITKGTLFIDRAAIGS